MGLAITLLGEETVEHDGRMTLLDPARVGRGKAAGGVIRPRPA
jgi:hypothetical protein